MKQQVVNLGVLKKFPHVAPLSINSLHSTRRGCGSLSQKETKG